MYRGLIHPVFVIPLFILIASIPLFSQSLPDFSEDFSTDPNHNGKWTVYRYNGSIYYEGDWNPADSSFFLTRASGNKACAAFIDYQLAKEKWIASFDFKIGGGTGADGLSFNFYKDQSKYGTPAAGGALGFMVGKNQSVPGYGIAFIQYQTQQIALIQNTVFTKLKTVNKTIRTNSFHHVKIQYDNGFIQVYMDEVLALSYTISNPDYRYSGVGFSAATGLARDNHIIKNFKLFTGDLRIETGNESTAWKGGSNKEIQWNVGQTLTDIDHFDLSWSEDNGQSWSSIAQNIQASERSYTWSVPDGNLNSVRLQILAKNANNDTLETDINNASITIDSQPPGEFSLRSPTNGSWTNARPGFYWYSSSDNYNLSHYRLDIDGVVFRDSINSTSYFVPSDTSITAGPHYWNVTAVDHVGNTTKSRETWSFEVDAEAPQPFTISEPSHDKWHTGEALEFKWQPSADTESGLDRYILNLRGEDGSGGQYFTQQTAMTPSHSYRHGEYNWFVQARDKVLNTQTSLDTFLLKIDNIPPGGQQGLYTDYYYHPNSGSSPSFGIFIKRGISSQINFNWERNAPSSGVPKEDFQIRWTGYVYADNAGSYRFITNTDDGVRLWINDDLIINAWIEGANRRVSQPVHLEAGSFNSIKMEFYENRTYAKAYLSWTTPDNSSERIIPSTNLSTLQTKALRTLAPQHNQWVSTTMQTFQWDSFTDYGIGTEEIKIKFSNNVVRDGIHADSTRVTIEIPENYHQSPIIWYLIAIDSLGNQGASASKTFRLDLSQPRPFTLVSPMDSASVRLPTPDFSWEVTSDSLSGLSHYQLWLNGSLNVDNITSTTTAPSNPLSQGIHEWTIKAVDNVGFVRQASETFHLIYDRIKPDIPTLLSPSEDDTTVTGMLTFTWRKTTDQGSGIKQYEFHLDGILHSTLTDTTISLVNKLENGAHNWFVKAVDYADNKTASQIVNFHVHADITPPVVSFVFPQNEGVIGGGPVQITGSTTDDDNSGDHVSGVEYVELSIDSGDWIPVINTGTDFSSWSYEWAGYEAGQHTLRARARDRTGNVSAVASINITVNISVPTISNILVNPNPTGADTVAITLVFSDDDGLDYAVLPSVAFMPHNSLSDYPVQQTGYENSTWTGFAEIMTNMPNGSARLQIQGVIDIYGNAMDSTVVSDAFIIDTVPPEISAHALPPGTAPVSVQPGLTAPGTVNFTINFYDSTSGINPSIPPAVTFTTTTGTIVSIIQTGFNANGLWTGRATIDTTFGDGLATLTVNGGQDLAGNVMAAQPNVGTFVIDATAPLPFTLLSPITNFWTAAQKPLLQWNATSDVTAGLERYQLFINNSLNVEFISPDSSVVRPTTPLPDAVYSWHIVAIDSAGNQRKSSENRIFNVDITPPISTITSPAAGDTLQETIIITGTASDREGVGVDSVFVSTDNGANWNVASIVNGEGNTNSIAATNSASVEWQYEWQVVETGVRIIKSKSVDALGNAAISDSGIVVQLRNFQPQITAISDTSVFEDSLFTMHVFASDANPLDSLFFTDNSNFFEVKTITSGHGLVEFTPTNETVGNHQITIYASDGQMIDSTRFNFAVINTNDAPLPFELLSPANGATTDSLNLSLSWVAAVDVDQGDSLYYQVMVSIREDFSDTLMISNTGTTLYRIPAGLQRSMQYFWQVTAIDQAGEKSICKSIFSFTTSGVATDVDGRISGLIPTEFALSQNYPNPFNPETRMEIQLPQNSHIRVMIFNMLGQRVTTLLDERKQAGYYELLWNGQNDAGQRMSSGIYIVSMQAEGFSFNRKMALVQ